MNNIQLLKPREVDLLLRYPAGRAARLAKRGLLPSIRLPDGEIRFRETDVRKIITDTERKTEMTKKKKRMVVVTTDKDRRGVFFGELISNDGDGNVVLRDAQMAVYWSTETHGVAGLASIGPQDGSRISPIVPQIAINGVTAVMDTSVHACKQWRKELWN